MKKLISLLLVIAIAFTGLVQFSGSAASEAAKSDTLQFAQDISKMLSDYSKTLAQFDNSEFSTSRLIVKSNRKIDTLDAVSVLNGYDNMWILQFENPQRAKEAYEYYSTRTGIEYVEPDRIISASSVDESGYPVFNSEDEPSRTYISWGPEHIGTDILNNALKVQNYPVQETTVAVIDSGVDHNHPMLKDRVIPTKINTSTSGTRNSSMDDNGHGTAVASVIIDSTLDNVYVKPYKVLDEYTDGTILSVTAGINCAIDDGVDVINLSLCFEEDSEILYEAIRKAYEKDIMVIAAAGNHGSDAPHYPAAYREVISVSALNQSNIIANFSNYGETIDFAAPGVQITVAKRVEGYTSMNGTSFAAPFVSAVAATLRGIDKNASADDVEEIMKENAVKIAEVDSAIKYGAGLVHAPDPSGGYSPFEKAETPVFSISQGFFFETQYVEISCATPDSVIYYTTDRSIPTKTNPTAKIYDGTPITVERTIVITATAYAPNLYRSGLATTSLIIAPYADPGELVVDENGVITDYIGNKFSISVPEVYNGITVRGVGEAAFKNAELQEVILPKTVTFIGKEAFAENEVIKTVYAINATKIGEKAFYNCINIKNLFLGEITEIGSYSFYNACRNQYDIYGTTFNLNLFRLTTIPEGAFTNSALASFEADFIDNIGKDAFSECIALASLKINCLLSMPDGAFRGCSSLDNAEIGYLTFVPRGAFSTCTNLRYVSFPNATDVLSNAFENCITLEEVNLPLAQTVYSNAFTKCESLYWLNLPEMQGFEEDLYTQAAPKIYFPPNLRYFSAPKMTKTIMNMFSNTPKIMIIDLSGVESLDRFTFRGANNIFILYLSNIKNIQKNAFDGSTIMFIDARNLVSTESLPENGGIMLSNSFVESSANVENLTIYGSSGTFIERYADYKGYDFVPIPFVYSNLPDYITENSETVTATAIGFDLEYQWYWNTKKSTEGGTPIEGAVTENYTFTDKDTAPYYYCKIIQNDHGKITSVYTKIITKDSKPADYTAYNEAVKAAEALDRNLYKDFSELDILLKIDISEYFSCEQNLVDEHTAKIYEAINALEYNTITDLMLFTFDEELLFLDSTKLIAVAYPENAIPAPIEWSTSDTSVIILSSEGEVISIGKGTATIKAKVTNIDGSVVEETIDIECHLTVLEGIISLMIKSLVFLIRKLSLVDIIIF